MLMRLSGRGYEGCQGAGSYDFTRARESPGPRLDPRNIKALGPTMSNESARQNKHS